MGIDLQTLILIIGITHLMQILVFYNQYKTNKNLAGPGWWLLWSAAESLAFGLILLRGIPSLLPLVIVFQDVIIISGTFFVYIGIMRFFNRKVNQKLVISAFTGFVVLHLFFFLVYNSIEARTLLLDVYLSVIAFVTAIAIFKNKTDSIASTAIFNMAIFIIHGSIFAFRTVMIILGVSVGEALIPNLFNLVQYFDALLVSLLWTFGFIMMMNQRLNAEISEAKYHFELIFNTSPDAVAISRLSDGTFIDCNEGYSKITGYKKEDILGKSSLDIRLWDNPAHRDSVVSMIQANGYCDNQEIQFHSKKGEVITGLLSAKLVTLQGVPHLMSVTRDITDRKNKEQEIRLKNEELLKMNAEKDKFFSIIAHDLRGPIGSFMGLTERMAEGIKEMTLDELQKIVQVMNRSSSNLYSLLGNLLEWSRMQRGLTTFQPVPFLLRPKIQEIISFAHDAATKKEIEINITIPGDLEVFADENMLASIIRNLLGNAVKFTSKGGNVSISAGSTAGNNIELTITDNGIGMNKHIIENLFNIDVNTSRKGTDGEPSTGLGLMICKDFIEKHGSKLYVESENGNGSTFRFNIPFYGQATKD